MAEAYSQDLRIRALELIKTGMSISQVSRLLKISRPTLYRWVERFCYNRFNGSKQKCATTSTVKNSRLAKISRIY